MQTPVRFLPGELDPEAIAGGIDDAFARFASDMLGPEYPDLHCFPTGGKDGGIDFVATRGTDRVVGDFKFIGSEEVGHAQRAWRTVKDRLQRNLSNSAPLVGQSQYAPWFDADRPLREYCFVVSVSLKNLSSYDALTDEIQRFFAELTRAPHLSHLSNLLVRLIDWSDFESQLASRPNVLLRWFPRTRPLGLVPLGDGVTPGSFRAYLRSDRLGFYSRARHRDSNPTITFEGIPDEGTLLTHVDCRHVTGLVITGAGGYGKTRLSLEIARVAEQQGWLVLRIVGVISAEIVAELGARLTPEQPTLLVVDYVETQRGFAEFVDSVNALNDSFGLRVGYVASCRTSFYPSVAALTRHERIDLAPPAGGLNVEWERSYRIATVSYILARGDLASDENAKRICRDLPVLAVFLLYLHERNRKHELESLLREQDFGQWVARRVQASFGAAPVSRQLATLASLLPLSQLAAARLTQSERDVLDRLSTDGWVEQDEVGGDRQWVAAHDVLVDQVVLSYLDAVRSTIALFLDDVFVAAERVGATRSALAAMQRIGAESILSAVSWPSSLAQCLKRAPDSWKVVRPELFSTSLLGVDEGLALLRDHDEFWSGAERDVDFQNRIGWVCRGLITRRIHELPQELCETLVDWATRAAREARASNFVLTWGLRLAPVEVRDAARFWIATKAAQFQSHYLMVSWLESGLGHSSIRPFVEAWLRTHGLSFHTSFLVRAWLDAGGEPEVVRAPIIAWLAEHELEVEAQFVYRAWLDATGEPEVVRAPIIAWLAQHQLSGEAQFVYRGWLDAKGAREVVRAPIIAWLAQHQLDVDAQFVYRAWLDATGEPEVVRASIIAWLAEHQLLGEAQFVYQGWLDAKGEREVVRAPIIAWLARHQLAVDAQFVYRAWLDANGDPEFVRAPIIAWIGVHPTAQGNDHLYRAWLQCGLDWQQVASQALAWLHEHREEREATHLLKFITKQSCLPDESVRDVLHWCRKFATDEDALWRLSTLINKNEIAAELTLDLIGAAEEVLSRRVLDSRPDSTRSSQVNLVLASIASLELESPRLLATINRLLVLWLRNPGSFGPDTPPHPGDQQPELVARVVALLGIGKLDAGADAEALDRFAAWLALWDGEHKNAARSALTRARRR